LDDAERKPDRCGDAEPAFEQQHRVPHCRPRYARVLRHLRCADAHAERQSTLIQDIAHEAGHAIQDAELGLVDTATGALQWGSEALFSVAPSDIGVDTSQYANNQLNFGELFAEQGQEKVTNELGLTFVGPNWNADGSNMTQGQFDQAVQNIEQQVQSLYGVQGNDIQNQNAQAYWDDYSRNNYDQGDYYW
jgi:hypothetical protein